MRDIVFELEEHPSRAIFLRLADAIIAAIQGGRLRPGDRLPGTRALAARLKLHRNTVDAAYQEALHQGWLVAEPSRGTFVSRDLPVSEPTASAAGMPGWIQRGARPEATGQAPNAAEQRPLLHFSDGVPDPRLLPVGELARAFRRALTAPDFLASSGYGDPRGLPVLRRMLCEHLSEERGLPVGIDDLLITRGSQMALFLAAGSLLAPGESIAVEVPGYPLAYSAFRAAGARVVGVPVDADGISVDDLEKLAREDPSLRAVYVTPHHQYPTTATLGAARRLRLLDIARHYGLTIIEDDYDHEYRFDGKPVLPLAARAGRELSLVYVGSLSKMLAPGIRLGYAVARPDLLKRMSDLRQSIDRQGDVPLEQAIAVLMRDGELGRHARKSRRIYQARRDHLAAELERLLGNAIAFDLPAGGLAFWARIIDGSDAEIWSRSAQRLGLRVEPGLAYCLDTGAPPQAFRLGFASLNEAEITKAVGLLKRAAPKAISQ